MNIFEVLQLGNSSIREVNITALLGYFLNKHANHSIGDKLLCKVISIIDDNHNSILKKYSNSETIIEHKNIDIYIKLFNENDEEFHRIIIENKKKNTSDEEQLQRYYNSERGESNNVSITVLFITHENCNPITIEAYNSLIVKDGDSKKHIYWSAYDRDSTEYKNSIYKSLSNILENKDGINDYVFQTLKSFNIFLDSYVHVVNIYPDSDETDRMKKYKTVEKQNTLREEIEAENDNLEFGEVDFTTDSRFPRFCYNINDVFKVCIQSSNRESPTIRVLLRLVDRSQYQQMEELCNKTDNLKCAKGAEHYAYIDNVCGTMRAAKITELGNSKSIVNIIKKYKDIVSTSQ